MLNEGFALTAISSTRATVTWTADDADLVSWIFVNGVYKLGPLVFDTAARSAEISLSASKVYALEIHDLAEGVTPASINCKRQVKPQIWWRVVGGAKTYKVYQGIAPDSLTKIAEVEAVSGVEFQSITCPDALPDGWNFFSVTALDEYGTESAVESWSHRAYDLPDPASGITVTKTSEGIYSMQVS
jgi:hypothetical protein